MSTHSPAVEALRRLTFAARTSGGTAGPDAELMAACDVAEQVLVAALAAPTAEPPMYCTQEARIERLKDAIEGECDGLSIDDGHARAILEYLDGISPQSAPTAEPALTDERAQFEAWGLEYFNYGFRIEKNAEGDYEHDGTDTAWCAWQARAAKAGAA